LDTVEQYLGSIRNNPKVWLVTGCAGFIGSNLIEFLLSYDQRVIGLDDFSTGYQENIDNALGLVGSNSSQNFSFIEGDIADYDVCEEACKNVDIVLHHAALGSVPRSIVTPVVSNQSNVTGFLNMLTAAKNSGTRRFVYASSSSVYGDSIELPKVEGQEGEPLSPYAVMKLTNELYGKNFKHVYGMETIGLRYFNVFGRCQNPNGAYAAVIPKWIEALLNGKKVTINGDGETSRDFTYIDNVLQANLLAGVTTNESIFGSAVNIAVGGRSTLNELYSLIHDELSKNTHLLNQTKVEHVGFRKGDIRHSNANILKAQTLLGYRPTHDVYQGMAECIGWYIEKYGV